MKENTNAHAHDTCACGCENETHENETHEQEGCACGHKHHHEHHHGHEDKHEHGSHGCCCHDDDDDCVCGHAHGDSCSCCHDDDDYCGCGHDHGAETEENPFPRLIGALVLFVLALFVPKAWGIARPIAFLAAYLLAGYDVLWGAVRGILRGRVFDERFLMTLASVSALCIGEWAEAVAVMIFYQFGEAFQDLAVGRSRRSIRALLAIKPEYAVRVRGDEREQVAPELIEVGDVIEIRPGERVPLDGVVLTGRAALDTSALTGEALARDVEAGDAILSGCVNQSGLITVRVTKMYGESTVSRVMEMVEHAQSRKAKTEQFITRFARVYTPAVVFAAIALAVLPPLLGLGTWTDWLHRALSFLVCSCPCALVISVPLSFFGGIGAASKAGVLVKGSDYLEMLSQVDTIVMDKTGTLTTGTFHVAHLHPAHGVSEEELLHAAALAEQASDHPLALSIVRRAKETFTLEPVTEAQEMAGHGICAVTPLGRVLAGNEKLMEREGIKAHHPACALHGAVVHCACDGKYLGAICLSDTIKDDAKQAVAQMREAGAARIVMLTGDRQEAAQEVARALGIREVHAQLLPQDKMTILEEILQNANGRVAFVGDGINDAPALSRADVGVAMGALGSDAAIEAADVVLMTDEPSGLARAMRIARFTRRIVIQNIVFALAIKALVLLLSALGITGMWAAVFADVGVAMLAILNAMRTLWSAKRA